MTSERNALQESISVQPSSVMCDKVIRCRFNLHVASMRSKHRLAFNRCCLFLTGCGVVEPDVMSGLCLQDQGVCTILCNPWWLMLHNVWCSPVVLDGNVATAQGM